MQYIQGGGVFFIFWDRVKFMTLFLNFLSDKSKTYHHILYANLCILKKPVPVVNDNLNKTQESIMQVKEATTHAYHSVAPNNYF